MINMRCVAVGYKNAKEVKADAAKDMSKKELDEKAAEKILFEEKVGMTASRTREGK